MSDDEIEETREHTIKHAQMISNVVQIGKIVEDQPGDPEKPEKKACVLVHIGGENEGSYTRNWMTWVSPRAGYDAEWWMPEIDEQVLVVAPSGNLALGIIIGAVFRGDWLCMKEDSDGPGCKDYIPTEDDAHVHRKVYKDGSDVSYDRKEHTLSIKLKEKQEKEEPAIHISSEMKGDEGDKKGELKIQLGAQEEEQTVFDLNTGTADIKTTERIELKVGDSVINIKKDEKKETESIELSVGKIEKNKAANKESERIELTVGDRVIKIEKERIELTVGASAIKIEERKITLKSDTIELDAGTRLTVDGRGADVV